MYMYVVDVCVCVCKEYVQLLNNYVMPTILSKLINFVSTSKFEKFKTCKNNYKCYTVCNNNIITRK